MSDLVSDAKRTSGCKQIRKSQLSSDTRSWFGAESAIENLQKLSRHVCTMGQLVFNRARSSVTLTNPLEAGLLQTSNSIITIIRIYLLKRLRNFTRLSSQCKDRIAHSQNTAIGRNSITPKENSIFLCWIQPFPKMREGLSKNIISPRTSNKMTHTLYGIVLSGIPVQGSMFGSCRYRKSFSTILMRNA